MLGVLARLLRRWPRLRPAASLAHRLSGRLPTDGPVTRIGRLSTGARIVLDLRDHAQRHIYFYGLYEPETTSLVRRLVTPGSVVLDVGANCGYYSLLCADLGATVYAFEPQRSLAQALRDSARLNEAPVTVMEAACGSQAGAHMLYESSDPYFGGMATLVAGYYTLSRPAASVEVVTLDGFCEERDLTPDFVKIDVEGFEGEVLEGATRLLATARPQIVCELAFGREPAERALELVRAAGYEVFAIDEHGPRPLRDDETGLRNLYFRPRES